MASIEADLLGGRPSLVEDPHRWGKHVLRIPTTAGMLSLGLLPSQGRELAKLLNDRFGSAQAVLAELNAELRANGLEEIQPK